MCIRDRYRADAVSKSTDVGAVIPTTVLNQIVEKLESTGMILALVTRKMCIRDRNISSTR